MADDTEVSETVPNDPKGRTEADRAEADPTAYQPPQSLKDLKPWEGKAERGDKILLGSILGIMGILMLLLPLRPLLIARHPILLEFATGSLSAIGAGAAFARIGEAPLGLVIFAGVFGMMKFDWLFWLTGKRWGNKIVQLFAPSERARKMVKKAEGLNPWIVRLLVMAGGFPGIPAAMVYAFAGVNKMRLSTFLVFNAIGSAIMTGLVAGLGFGLGQRAVDVVLIVDKYALWLTLVLIVGLAMWSSFKAQKQTKAQH